MFGRATIRLGIGPHSSSVKLRHCTDVAQRRSTKLHDVWPSPGMVHYIYTFGTLAPRRNFARCKIHFASKSCLLLYCQRYCMALEQWASAKLCGVVSSRDRAAIAFDIGRSDGLVLCNFQATITANIFLCFSESLPFTVSYSSVQIYIKTRSTGTVHTSAKARLTSVAIRIRIATKSLIIC